MSSFVSSFAGSVFHNTMWLTGVGTLGRVLAYQMGATSTTAERVGVTALVLASVFLAFGPAIKIGGVLRPD